MKKFSIIAISFFLVISFACGHGRPADETETKQTANPGSQADQSTQQQTLPANSPLTPSTITPVSGTAPGMNPPHGQPGHRCDIAEGAPLSGAPAQQPSLQSAVTPNSKSPVSITPVQSPVQPSVTTTKTAPGMNPAHGEPGHRCDIAVGAPLNSAPTQPSTSKTTNTPAINTPVTSPLNLTADKPSQASTPTKTAPGMNPPHGEPGHRCEIAVGAPLDSKPTVVAGVPSKEVVTSSSIPSVVPVKPVPDSSKR